MLEFFHVKRDVPFMSYGKITTAISLLTFVAAVVFLIIKGLNFGVEFTGGTVLEVRYTQAANTNKIRERVDALKYGESQVQSMGTARDVLIRLPNIKTKTSAQLSDEVMNELKKDDAAVEKRKVEFIGPSVGAELVSSGLTATALVCLGIILYLAVRFEWRFAVSAVIANMHDVVIILGCFALFQWEFSLPVLSGVLAVLGYSVNESVVVFDRIRENFRKPEMRGRPITAVIDNAITATMSRTIITHGCTEMMILSMLFLGGPSLHYFAMALTIGIVFGIYSSVLVASPLLLLFGLTRESMIKPVVTKEEAVV